MSRIRVFPYPRSAVSILLARRQPFKPTKYALVKRRNPPKQGQWALPGGAVELGTTQLEQSYVEIEEELGLGRDRIMWLHQPLGCKDVIVKEIEHECEREKVTFHYTTSQLFAELVGNDDTLEAGDDADDAIWWSQEDLSAKNMKLDLVDGTTEIMERLELLVKSGQDFLQLQAPDLPTPPTETLVEVKKKMSGEEQRFDLELWQWDAAKEIVVGRWKAPPGGAYGLEEGDYSWGVWGRGVFGGLGVGAYRMHDKHGTLKGYRFDVLGGTRMETSGDGDEEEERVLAFDDLLLDGLVTRRLTDGTLKLVMEDEEEVVTFQKNLSKEQMQTIDAAREAMQGQASLCRLVGNVDDVIAACVRARRTSTSIV